MRTIPCFPPDSSQIAPGYIKTHAGEGALALAWWGRCARRNHPYVRLRREGASATLTFDLATMDGRLTPEGRTAIRSAFQSAARSWGLGAGIGHASGIRSDVAEALARYVVHTLRQSVTRPTTR